MNVRTKIEPHASTHALSTNDSPWRPLAMRCLLRPLIIAAAVLSTTAAAQTLDFVLAPGFWPDPHRVSYISGGSVDAFTVMQGPLTLRAVGTGAYPREFTNSTNVSGDLAWTLCPVNGLGLTGNALSTAGPRSPSAARACYNVHMSARPSRPSSNARGIRLPRALDEEIQREADRRGRSWSSLTAELLDEGVRLRRAPGVTFLDGPTGRRAVVSGTGIDVWEVIRTWKDLAEDLASTLDALPTLSELQVRSAIGYYSTYPEEIDTRLSREEEWTEDRLARDLPHARPRTP